MVIKVCSSQFWQPWQYTWHYFGLKKPTRQNYESLIVSRFSECGIDFTIPYYSNGNERKLTEMTIDPILYHDVNLHA